MLDRPSDETASAPAGSTVESSLSESTQPWPAGCLPRPCPVVRTERLLLRTFTPGDHHALHAIMSCPETFLYSDRGPMSPEESWARLLRHVGHWTLFGFGMFAVEELESGELIGEIGLADFRRDLGPDFDGVPEAAWTLAPHVWGRGYASEATLAAHRWIAGQHIGDRTVCLIHKDNDRSLRVAARLGYEAFAEQSYRGYPAILFGCRRSG